MTDIETPKQDPLPWEERLDQEPSIDIDFWTLLLESRIVQA